MCHFVQSAGPMEQRGRRHSGTRHNSAPLEEPQECFASRCVVYHRVPGHHPGGKHVLLRNWMRVPWLVDQESAAISWLQANLPRLAIEARQQSSPLVIRHYWSETSGYPLLLQAMGWEKQVASSMVWPACLMSGFVMVMKAAGVLYSLHYPQPVIVGVPRATARRYARKPSVPRTT